MTIGVYRITHTASGRFYIGSSANCERRMYHHRWSLDQGKHHNRRLLNCWAKYGPDAFSFEIIEVCASQSEALESEQRRLDAEFDHELCINGSRKARMPILDPEVRARAAKAQAASEHYKAVRRRVCVERNSDPAFQAKARAGILASAKFKAARKKGVQILLSPEVRARNQASLKNSEKQKAAARKIALKNLASGKMEPKRRAVVGTSLTNGVEIRFESQSAAARFLGISSSNISMACAGKVNSIKGYRWRNVT